MRLARVRLGSVSLICLLQVVLCMAVSAEHAYAFSNAVVKKDSETIDDLASRGFDYGSLDIPEDVRQKLSESALTVRRLPRVLRTEGSEKRSKSIRYSSQKAYVEALLRLTEQVEKLTAVDTVADVRENVKALIQTRNELSSLNKEIQAVFAETGKKCVSKRFDGKILERHRELVAAYAETHREIMQSLDVIERICRGGIPTIRELEVIIGESGKLHEFLKSRKLKEPPPLINAESLPYTSERRNPKNLPMSAAGKHFESITPKDVVLPFSPPEPADLQLTIDVQITPEIAALAASLDHSPYKIFKYVRDNFEFDAYMGSRKGSSETLREHSGNAYDLCSLLIALLRASNVPTRYVTGVVMMPVEQARNWLGFNDTVEAANLIATALDSGAVLWWEGDNPVSISFRHAWVIAYLPYADYRGVENDDTGKMWIPLDPSVKEFVYQEGIDIPTEMGFDAESFVFNEYVSTFHELSPVELYVDRIQQHLAVAHPGLLYPDILRLGTIVPFGLETLPGSTPYLVRTLDDAFAGIPAYLRYRIRFRIHDDSSVFVDHTANLPDIAGKRVTISYVAATEADQDVIDSYGGLYETPPHLVRLRPVLKIGGADVAMGPDSGIMMGITHESDMYFYPPFGAGNQIPEVHNPVISGTYQGIGIETGRIPADVFVPSDEGELPDVDGFTGGKLYQTAMEYLQKIEWPEDTVAQTMRMVVTKDVSEAIVENTILVTFVGGTPWTFEWKALTVDADRCIVGPFSVDGDDTKAYDYMVLTGADGSIQENRVFEDMYDQEAISAVKILELANDMGIPVCRISGNIDVECPGNNWPAQVRSAVAAAIARGHVVTIPRAGITHHEWSGIGYIDMDPASGAAGYIISGGHAGGSTVDIWDSWKMTWFTIFRKITSITAVINHPAQNEYFPQVSWWDFFGWALYFDVDYTIRYDDGSSRSVHERFNPHYPYSAGDYTFYAGWGTSATRDFTVFGVEIGTPDGEETYCEYGGCPYSILLSANIVPRTPPSTNYTWTTRFGLLDWGEGTFNPQNGSPTRFSGTKEGSVTVVVEANNANGATTATKKLSVVKIQMKLEKVGNTVIEPANNYSENTTVRVTAVNPKTGEACTGFTGTVDIAEDTSDPNYVPIYSQHTDKGANLPSQVTIASGGSAVLVAKSLSDPKSSSSKPDDALIDCTNFDVYGGNPLHVSQWTDDFGQVHSKSSGSVYDWFETRTRDVLNQASGDVKTVLGRLDSYTQCTHNDHFGAIPVNRADTNNAHFNPHFASMRLDSDAGSMASEARDRAHTNTVIHESRHCYQMYLCNSNSLGNDDDLNDGDRKNDEDSDYLVDSIPIAPTNIFLDTTTSRSVWNTGNTCHDVSYSGDIVKDDFSATDQKGARNALEKDAYKFANDHD